MIDKYNTIIYIVLILVSMFLGWAINEAYEDMVDKGRFAGLRFEYDSNWSKAVNHAYEANQNRGDWICVNVKGMDFNKAQEVVMHEIGHEIFATKCETNLTKCIDAVNG